MSAKQRRQRIYHLEPGEVARLVPPPVATPLFQLPAKSLGWPASELYRVFYGSADSGWQEDRRRYVGTAASTVESVLAGEHVQVLNHVPEFEVPGDWVVDRAAREEGRAAAAKEILHKAAGRDIVFHHIVKNHPCIVAEGMVRRQRANKVEDPGVDSVATPDVLLNRIAKESGHRLVTRVLWSDVLIGLELHGRLERTRNDARELDRLLEDVARQTSLKVRRDVVREVTFVVREQGK